jgi:AbrB family looped-hinge helix DNA binding protein
LPKPDQRDIILPVRKHNCAEGGFMASISTTKMSSKGQVVIPEAIRKKLGLKSGDQFVVTGNKDVVILKSILPPSLDEFDDLIAEARRQARKAGMKRSDIVSALNRVRGKK